MTNSSESTGNFRRTITSADVSNIVTVLDMLTLNGQYTQFEEDYILGFAGMLESFQVSVGLFSLKPADFPATTPLMTEGQKQAEIARIQTNSQKMALSIWIAKGNGPWEYLAEAVLLNNANNESYVPLLVPYLTVNEVMLIGRDFRLGVKVENQWQGPLKTNDYLVVQGSWRQRVTFSAKKNELELVLADIEALKLAFFGKLTNLSPDQFLGSGAGGGVAVPIPQSNFVAVSGNKSIGGIVNFTNTTASTSTTTGSVLFAGGVGVAGSVFAAGGSFSAVMGVGNQVFDFTNSSIKAGIGTVGQDACFSLHCSGTGLGIFGFDFSAVRFVLGSNGGTPIDLCTNVGGVPYGADNLASASPTLRIQGQNILCPVLPTSPSGLPSGALWRNGNTINVV